MNEQNVKDLITIKDLLSKVFLEMPDDFDDRMFNDGEKTRRDKILDIYKSVEEIIFSNDDF